MLYEKRCECCGHVERVYFHSLNKPMILALQKLCDYYLTHRKRVKLHDLGLNNNDFNNFQKLQYWNLVHRTEEGYLPTGRAYNFMIGNFNIETTVGTWNGQLIGYDHEAWLLRKKSNELVNISNYNLKLDDRYQNLNNYLNY